MLALMVFMGLTTTAAFASDHLFNATTSPGSDNRGFNNPVAANPSGVSGPAAEPGLVPGEGDPNGGGDTTTPAVNCDLLNPNADPAFCD